LALELEINLSLWGVGCAGMDLFCVVHIAPQALANFKASLNFDSFFMLNSIKQKQCQPMKKKLTKYILEICMEPIRVFLNLKF